MNFLSKFNFKLVFVKPFNFPVVNIPELQIFEFRYLFKFFNPVVWIEYITCIISSAKEISEKIRIKLSVVILANLHMFVIFESLQICKMPIDKLFSFNQLRPEFIRLYFDTFRSAENDREKVSLVIKSEP